MIDPMEIGNEMNEAYCDGFEAGVQSAKQKWIPVAEKTPEGRQYVLCCGAIGGMFVGWVCDYRERDNGKATAFLHGGHGRKITHWMPLPEPPEDKD